MFLSSDLSKSGTHTQNECFCFLPVFAFMVVYVFVSLDQPNTCKSTGSQEWDKFFGKKVRTLQPGSPCNDFRGYCDVFMKCRLVDADGPLARLKEAIFNPELYENIAEWIVASVSLTYFNVL